MTTVAPQGRLPLLRKQLTARRSALLLVVALAVVLPGTAHASHWRPGACGLPTALPLHVEYAEVAVSPVIRTEIFAPARPPLVLATSGAVVPQELRAGGAHTVFWYMKLERLVGTPNVPADPAAVAPAADRMLARAVEQSGCATPVIALNELWGAYLPTPWSPTVGQYRANVLALLQRLHALGAHPYLMVVSTPRPFTDAPDAVAWWTGVAAVSDLVLQVHFDGRFASRLGAISASRRRRVTMRRVIAQFEAIGVPAARIGLLHGFQSGPGAGGRERLPLTQWLRVVKWEALAAKHVAAERAAAGTPLASDWSWGWADFVSLSPTDPDKPVTACVYLWTRDPALCDGPARAAAAGTRFNPSLTEGQLALAPGVQCTVGRPRGTILTADVDRLALARADSGAPLGRRAALATLFGRIVERRRAVAREGEVDRAERNLVFRRFAGAWQDYEAALLERNLTHRDARAVIADQVRRRKIASQLRRSRKSFRRWAAGATRTTLATTTCLNDDLPRSARPDLSLRLGFLRLT